MELKGASLSSAARGEVGRQRAPEGVLCGEEDGGRSGVSGRCSRVGRRGRWVTASLELTEPAAEQAGRVAFGSCARQREEEEAPDRWGRAVSGTGARGCGVARAVRLKMDGQDLSGRPDGPNGPLRLSPPILIRRSAC